MPKKPTTATVETPRRKPGRPALTAEQRQDRQGLVKLAGPIMDEDDRRLIDLAAHLTGKTQGSWCRDVLVAAARDTVRKLGPAILSQAQQE
jgi:uncharacterized protein (DUF1778 family)